MRQGLLAFRTVVLLLTTLVVAAKSPAATVIVYAYNTAFSLNPPGQPTVSAVTIFAGDSVRWVWLQGNHTTVSAVGSAEQWNAPLDQSTSSYERVFNNPGTFWYRCDPHGVDNGDGTTGGMYGTITVLPASAGACCLPDGSCETMSSASCAAAGGSFQGPGSNCASAGCSIQPIELTLQAASDAMLFESATGTVANGAGSDHYVGNASNGSRRRFAVRFETSAIPAGATVVDATLRMRCSSSSGSAIGVSLRRLLASWGEGASDPSGNENSGTTAVAGDLTWLHRFYPSTPWAVPGGEFAASVSATTPIGAAGVFAWSSPALTADVQGWVDQSAGNFGWIVRGDEATSNNTKRFDTRSATASADRPSLTVRYLPPLPTGACCLPDGTCIEEDQTACEGLGGTYRGNGVSCLDAECPVVLTPFVDRLPIPAVAQPTTGQAGGAASYEIAMTERFQQLHRDLPPTRVWTYAGSYPGPTIEARRGMPVEVVWRNDLRVAETGALRSAHWFAVDECLHGPNKTGQVPYTVVHLHGGAVDQQSDGHPDFAFPPGQQSSTYRYPNAQRAATLWYHDHALGLTRLNVMMGLAGVYLIRDAAELALGLPSGAFEVPLLIQDRSFRADGSLRYDDTRWSDSFFGDTVLVNGKVWPFHEVSRGKYRFRLLNGSNTRVYRLALSDNSTFWQIGTDQGLIAAPRAISSITILPGERADVVVDFAPYAPGTAIEFVNSAPAPFPGFGEVGVVPDVIQFRVGSSIGHVAPLPASLAPYEPIDPADAVEDRVLELMIAPNLDCPSNPNGMWMIDANSWETVTEFPLQGSTELWTWKNDSGVSHPMHIHLSPIQLVGRQLIDPTTGMPSGPMIPPDPQEVGWKDTVDARPGYFTTVAVRFEGTPGRYPYHCHTLEHEDHEMMRQFELLADCDANGVADSKQLSQPGSDCDGDGRLDACEIADGAADCNGNGVLDSCDIAAGAADCDANGVPDACDIAAGAADCNANGVPDACDIAAGAADCNANGVPDACDIAAGAADCNANGVPDACDIAGGSQDVDGDGRPDACERARGDFDLNGAVDAADLAMLLSNWGSPASAEFDLNGDGSVGGADLALLLGNWGPLAW